jgi:hypothetical protein
MVQGGEVSATDGAAPERPSVLDLSSSSAVSAVDVVVRWGDWVLTAQELSPPRTFVVAEQGGDVVLPAEIIGAARLPVLLARWDGAVRLVVPHSARVLLGGQTKRMSAARCISKGFGQASTTVKDAAEITLLPGQTATLFLQSVAIDVERSAAAPRPPRRPVLEKRLALAQAGSLLFHAILLGILFFFIGPAPKDEDGGISDEQKFELQQRLNRIADKEMESDLDRQRDGYERRARRNGRRWRAAMAEKEDELMRALEAGARGWTDELAAEAQRDEAPRSADQGLIGVLYDWPAPVPTTPRAGATYNQRVPSVTLAPDKPMSWKRGPSVRMGATTISGRLPPEVVQRIVRQNFGRFRLCYENGLRNNPNLQGRVSVRFVIGRDGAVSNLSNGGSDMPDGSVVACVVRAFQGLSFPQPEGGIVSVLYPIMFSPGD